MIAASDKKVKAKENHVRKQLVLFDFDGTITTKDTLAEFMIFYHGKIRYLLGLAVLSPILASYVFKLMPNWKSKQYFLTWFLKNEDVSKFNKKCFAFSEKYMHKLVRPGALDAIRQHQKAGADVAVVSASAENWVKPWCDQHNLICISTKLEVKENRLTGKILGKNCHGPEKVCRIKENFDLSHYNEIIAYGDTAGDNEMLALANLKHYKPFR
jgi:HAD superfamily hydrolase (TIGR01490 family)